MKDTRYIAATILKCGILDINFLDTEINSYESDLTDIIKALDYPFDFNSVIGELYNQAITNANLDREKHNISIFTNYLDSHLHIDGNEVSCLDDIREIAKQDIDEQLQGEQP